MSSNIDFVFAHIGAHNNWRVVENYLKDHISCHKKIKFISFCEMYFYKGGSELKEDWVGILHDPEDSEKYNPDKNILKHHVFRSSLPRCKGLFCMSDNLKEWVIQELHPKFFVHSLYHPLSDKNLSCFDFSLYQKKTRIVQIGNWLRKTYSIYKLKCNHSKEILPFNSRTHDELVHFMHRDNISLTNEEKKSVTERQRISDEDYDKLFIDHLVFLDLYSSTYNNVIIECITANCPIIVNRIPPVEKYLGKHYPLYYDRLDQVKGLIDSGCKVLEAYYYLKQMNKERFMIENIAKEITLTLGTIL